MRSTRRLYAALALVGLVAYCATSGTAQDLVSLAIGSLSASALVVGTATSPRGGRAVVAALLLGQLLWVAGDAVTTVAAATGRVLPLPSPADGAYLAAYPACAAGLWLLIRRSRADRAHLLDTGVVSVGLGVVIWTLVGEPVLRAGGSTAAGEATQAAYVAADIALVALVTPLLALPRARTAFSRRLIASLLALLVADTAGSLAAPVSASLPTWLDPLYMVSYLLLGAAALQPLPAPEALEPARPTAGTALGRLVALGVAAVVAPATLVVELVLGAPHDDWVLAAGTITAFVLVLLRMHLAAEQIAAAADARDALREQLVHQATHDPLTGLANRSHALSRLSAALDAQGALPGPLDPSAGAAPRAVGLLFVDLDHFKAVNDEHGHRAGDRVLCEVADRLREVTRAGDLVGRLDGDEFVIVTGHLHDAGALTALGQRVVDAVRQPIAVSTTARVRVGASVGALLARPSPGLDAARALHEADLAAYRAKRGGRSRVVSAGELTALA